MEECKEYESRCKSIETPFIKQHLVRCTPLNMHACRPNGMLVGYRLKSNDNVINNFNSKYEMFQIKIRRNRTMSFKLFRKIKQRHQRAKRGYSDVDVWNFDNWFLDTIPKMLLELRNNTFGYSLGAYEEVEEFPKEWVENQKKDIAELEKKHGSDEDFDFYDKNDEFHRWLLILTRIAWCFQNCRDEDSPETTNSFDYDTNKKLWEMRQEEISRYEKKNLKEGFDLMSKYFTRMWW